MGPSMTVEVTARPHRSTQFVVTMPTRWIPEWHRASEDIKDPITGGINYVSWNLSTVDRRKTQEQRIGAHIGAVRP